MAVLNGPPAISPGISRPTYHTAYTPFTPSNSEQRSPPTYYRGCWHVVSRGFFIRYHQTRLFSGPFFPIERGLRPEGLHPSRGVAASPFRTLCKIPHCCLPDRKSTRLNSSHLGISYAV